MIDLEKEAWAFNKLSTEQKQEKIGQWVHSLAEHYDYFRDLEIYINDHKTELDDDFLNATFQIVLNLAKEIENI